MGAGTAKMKVVKSGKKPNPIYFPIVASGMSAALQLFWTTGSHLYATGMSQKKRRLLRRRRGAK